MKFLKKLVEFFKKTKQITETVQFKIKKFVQDYKPQIRVLMNILDAIYPAKTGIGKMAKVVDIVCGAMNLEEYSDTIKGYVETECQKIYDELKK